MKKLMYAVLLVSWACAPVNAEPDGSYTVTLGVDVSSGDYGGTEETDLIFMPVSLSYSSFPWTFRLTVPYLRIDGPVSVVDGQPVATTSANNTTEDGLGDLSLAVTYSVEDPLPGGIFVDLKTRLKAPTASRSKGLGTGRRDISVQADLFKAAGNWTPFATLGYKFTGDPPDLDLNDSAFASIGTDYRLKGPWHLGASLDYREPISQLSDDGLEFVPYAAWRIRPSVILNTYLVLGLSDGSPDQGFGLQLSYKR